MGIVLYAYSYKVFQYGSNVLNVPSLYCKVWGSNYMLIVSWQMLSSKDVNFVGYTYKNFEIVNDHQVPGVG